MKVTYFATSSVLAAALLWGAPAAPAQELPSVRANLNDDCIGGFFWPAGVPVNVVVRDSGGKVVYSTARRTSSQGELWEIGFNGTERCDVPFDLRPGMSVTASDGTTTKQVVLQQVTYDQLDPETNTAAGTAPAGNLFVDVFTEPNAEKDFLGFPGGAWSVDFGALGVDVKVGSAGDVFAFDADQDATVADHFVTAVSLNASVPAGASSRRAAGAAATTVVRRGSRVRLSGKLSAGTRDCVRRKRVKLLKLSGRRTRTLAFARTSRRGRYAFIRTLRKSTRFRVRYGGNRRCQRSSSRIRAVRVTAPPS